MPSPTRMPLRGSELPLHGARLANAVDPRKTITVSVKLRRKSEEGLSGPGVRGAFRHLDRREYLARHGADESDARKVSKFASEHGLSVTEVDLERRHLGLAGTTTAMGHAFGVVLANYQLPKVEGVFRAHQGEVHLPTDLNGIVRGVFGLDNLPVVRPHFRTHADDGQGGETASAFKPGEVAELYNFPSDVTGKAQSIAILEFGGGFEPAVLDTYFQKYLGMPRTPSVHAVSIDGVTNSPYARQEDVATSGEVYLDIEMVGAVAPDADVSVYFAPFTAQGFVDAIDSAIIHSHHMAISISYGLNEDLDTRRPSDGGVAVGRTDPMLANLRRNVDEAFLDAYHLGVPVFVSAGDNGSSNTRGSDGSTLRTQYAHISYPASSPYATACGGTMLYADGDRISREVAWNELGPVRKSNGEFFYAGGATGGGVSDEYPVPPFQRQAGLEPATVNPSPDFPATGRGLPDVAGNAGASTGYLVTYPPSSSTNHQVRVGPVGGTSAVAPLWAALIALINEKLDGRVGELNDFLYQHAGEGLVSITEGNNSSAAVGGYEAASGWDLCTGWGRPDGQALVKALESWIHRKT